MTGALRSSLNPAPRNGRKMPLLLAVLLAASLVTLAVSAGLGSVHVPLKTSAAILLSRAPLVGGLIPQTWDALQESIVLNLRLPRVCLGFVVGASLAVCGVTMQALVRNSLADPFILGVSSGAEAFATLGVLFGAFSFLGTYSLAISSFLGAAFTFILVYSLSRVRGKLSIAQLLLSGVAVSMIMNGITNIITLSAPNALGIHNALFWMSGSLAGARWAYLTLPFVVLLLCMAVLMANYRALNLLLLGDESASSLGVNVKTMQKVLVIVASLMAGVTVSVSGSIGFVGLMVPHFARLIAGADHKRVLPISALLGGILVVWTDAAARTVIAPEELPAGVLTAVFGGPVFIWMLKKRDKEKT